MISLVVFTKMRNPFPSFFFAQTEYARFENGRYVFRIHRSPLCEYMINFIHKLKHLPEKYMMNSVLENFTILQVNHPWYAKLRISLKAWLVEAKANADRVRSKSRSGVRNSSSSSITNPVSVTFNFARQRGVHWVKWKWGYYPSNSVFLTTVLEQWCWLC